MSVTEYKKKVKFVTGAADGMVKVWSGMHLKKFREFKVAGPKVAVTAICFMSASKRLAVATTDRMISFFGMDQSSRQSTEPPKSRIEDLPAVPLCLEYVKHNKIELDAKKNTDEKQPIETLLFG